MPGLNLSHVRVGRSVQHGGVPRECTFPAEDRQVTKQSILIASLVASLGIFLLCDAIKATAAEFTYRGVKFGMTREEVSKLVPLDPDSNRAARSGFADKNVNFQFDDRGQLYVIEISYLLEGPLAVSAMRRALQKKYGVSNASEGVWDLDDVLVSIDEYYGNPSHYLRTTITHKRLYDEYLDRLASRFAPALQD